MGPMNEMKEYDHDVRFLWCLVAEMRPVLHLHWWQTLRYVVLSIYSRQSQENVLPTTQIGFMLCLLSRRQWTELLRTQLVKKHRWGGGGESRDQMGLKKGRVSVTVLAQSDWLNYFNSYVLIGMISNLFASRIALPSVALGGLFVYIYSWCTRVRKSIKEVVKLTEIIIPSDRSTTCSSSRHLNGAQWTVIELQTKTLQQK